MTGKFVFLDLAKWLAMDDEVRGGEAHYIGLDSKRKYQTDRTKLKSRKSNLVLLLFGAFFTWMRRLDVVLLQPL